MKTLIKNCRLISPDTELECAAILIRDERISLIFSSWSQHGFPLFSPSIAISARGSAHAFSTARVNSAGS